VNSDMGGGSIPPPPQSDSVFSSDAPLPAFDLGELTPGSPLGTGDLPPYEAPAQPAVIVDDYEEDEEDEEEGNNQTIISASTKDWAALMGGMAAGTEVTVPRAISVADIQPLSPQILNPDEDGLAASASNDLPAILDPATQASTDIPMIAEPVIDMDLPIEEPVMESIVEPDLQDVTLDPGTYSVENESLSLPDVSFQSPGGEGNNASEAPQLLPLDALTEIAEQRAASEPLPTGEYSLEGNNVIAMPWLDGSDSKKSSSEEPAPSNGSEEGVDDLFEDPVEMAQAEESDDNQLDGTLASFLKDL